MLDLVIEGEQSMCHWDEDEARRESEAIAETRVIKPVGGLW